MLEIRLLGQLEARIDGVAVEPPASRRAWALLGWLALHPGEHPRGALAARFWPDVLDRSARQSLRSALWALRRALGPAGEHHLLVTRDRVGLDAEVWTDRAEWDRLLAAGDLERAVALCRGPLLDGIEDDWAWEARDAHREALGDLLGQLATRATAAGDHTTAAGWARRRVALDPLAEEATAALMRTLAAGGDRTAALAAFRHLRDRLASDLGMAPSANLRALAADLRDAGGSPAIHASTDANATQGSDPGVASTDANATQGSDPGVASTVINAKSDPLVGRDDEVAALRGAWDAVVAGTGGVALVTGDAGFGKTRLASELRAHAVGCGGRVAICAGSEVGATAPLGVWAELARELAAGGLPAPPEDASWPDELARIVPSLPRRLGRRERRQVEPVRDPELQRVRLVEAAIELVEHAAADRPLLLVVEDAHVADASSLALLAAVARGLARVRALLLLTRRPQPRPPELDTLTGGLTARGAGVLDLELAPLADQALDALVRAAAAGLDATQRAGVVAQADGSPLLALEAARAAAAGRPSATLTATVRAELARLDSDARRLVELLAAAGGPLSPAELTTLADATVAEHALACGLLTTRSGRLDFRHALLRDAAYGELPSPRRAALHERLAAVLVRAPAETARHLRAAGLIEAAVEHLQRAAAEARAIGGLSEARAYLHEATALTPGRSDLLLELAEVEANRGDAAAAETALEAAIDQHPPSDHAWLAAAWLRGARWYRSSLCRPERVGSCAKRALAEFAAAGDGDPVARAEASAHLGWAFIVHGDAQAAGPLIEAAQQAVDPELHPLLGSVLAHTRGFAALLADDLDEAYAAQLEAAELALRAGRVDLAFGAWWYAACGAAWAGDPQRALEYVDRGVAALSRHGAMTVDLRLARAHVLLWMGEHEQAQAEAAAALALAERLGLDGRIAEAHHDTGGIALAAGDAATAARELELALAGEPRVSRPLARLLRAEALCALQQPEAAAEQVRAAALEPVRSGDDPAAMVARMCRAQALVAAAQGDTALARLRYEEAAAGWRRQVRSRGSEFAAAILDLGRPPFAGLTDPAAELERIEREIAQLEAQDAVVQ